MSYRLICGDAIEAMRELPANSVQCAISSPPYFGLRDYGTATWEGGDAACDHKQATARNDGGRVQVNGFHGSAKADSDKGAMNFRDTCGKCGARRIDMQIGIEATPDEYVARLVEVFREVRRVLHRSGQLFLNIGDSRSDGREWLGIPHRLVFALQADGWRWEDEVIWSKPNPMPGSQENRFTRAHEYVFMLNKSRDAFFDSEAVKEPHKRLWGENNGGSMAKTQLADAAANGQGHQGWNHKGKYPLPDPAGRTRRSVWDIPTESYEGSHYATFPTKLVEPCVLAGTSAYGCCAACGSPYERVVERAETDPMQVQSRWGRTRHADPRDKRGVGATVGHKTSESPRTTGWAATCQCGAAHEVIPCTVLDCFFGSGTTAAVALKHGRHFIGIDLDERNIELARTRIEQSQPMLIGDIT